MSYLFKTTLIGLFFGTFGTTIGGIIGALCELSSTEVRVLIAVIPFCVGIIIFFILSINNNKLIDKKTKIEKDYRTHYVCPKCFFSFRDKPYRNILLAGKCPNCKSEFKGTL